MKLSASILVAAAAVFVAGTAAAQEEKETKIKRSELPAAVERTVAIESRGATIRGFSRETENGQTFFEMELRVSGRTRDVIIDTTGTVVLVEQEVDFATLPEAVRTGLTAGAAGGSIVLVESLTKRGTLVAYEAHVKKGGKESEVQVGPDGKPLAHPE